MVQGGDMTMVPDQVNKSLPDQVIEPLPDQVIDEIGSQIDYDSVT